MVLKMAQTYEFEIEIIETISETKHKYVRFLRKCVNSPIFNCVILSI